MATFKIEPGVGDMDDLEQALLNIIEAMDAADGVPFGEMNRLLDATRANADRAHNYVRNRTMKGEL